MSSVSPGDRHQSMEEVNGTGIIVDRGVYPLEINLASPGSGHSVPRILFVIIQSVNQSKTNRRQV